MKLKKLNLDLGLDVFEGFLHLLFGTVESSGTVAAPTPTDAPIGQLNNVMDALCCVGNENSN